MSEPTQEMMKGMFEVALSGNPHPCTQTLIEFVLDACPTFDINTQLGDLVREPRGTLMHHAVRMGMTGLVSRLLKRTDVDLNARSEGNHTPLEAACWLNGQSFGSYADILSLLLKDPRVDVNLPNKLGYTPLFTAVQNGLDTILLFVAHRGETLDLSKKKIFVHDTTPRFETPLWYARDDRQGHSLLEDLLINRTLTIFEVRLKLKFPDASGTAVFALMVFVCDGLLRPTGELSFYRPNLGMVNKSGSHLFVHTSVRLSLLEENNRRFFNIASRLPMELQMVLARISQGSPKGSILSQESEIAFRHLARSLSEQ